MNDSALKKLRLIILAAVLISYAVIWHVFRIREPEFARAVRTGDKNKVIEMLDSNPAFIGITRNSRKMWNARTPLHEAVSAGRLDMVELLLSRGASLDGEEGYESPLQVAVSENYEGIARYLLEHRANPNSRDNRNNSPLHIACRVARTNVVGLLIEYGANVNATNHYGESPLILASERGWLGIASNLFEHGAVPVHGDVKTGRTSLHYAAQHNHENVAMFLLDKGVSIEIRDREGNTPLHYAVKAALTDMVRLLLDRGAQVNATNFTGATPMHDAVESNRAIEIAGILLQHGADINAVTEQGITPLSLAIQKKKSPGLLNFLEQKGGIEAGIIRRKGKKR
ncbi:MAG: ankyrin repeat domain-containing protein [Kiritimatiellae bacterium]|nr:ankyrin repeat domain-containing protein [Kiritimatiellia bacterium]MDD5523112.1 ankyrin repeat domain-containing protein [Kiritimatiellia bacterium]